jgi:hypothetical protein
MGTSAPGSMFRYSSIRTTRYAMRLPLLPDLGALFALAGGMWPSHLLLLSVMELRRAEEGKRAIVAIVEGSHRALW